MSLSFASLRRATPWGLNAPRLLPLAFLVAALLPRSASACQEPEQCDFTNKWLSVYVVSDVVASDGVVLIQGERGRDASAEQLDDAEALAALSAQVTVDGQPVTGALELDPDWAGLVWRPDTSLTPGATLTIVVSVDNESIIDDSLGQLDCPDEGFDTEPVEVLVGSDPTPGLEGVIASASHSEVQLLSTGTREDLDTIVCCDGAVPRYSDICGSSVGWSEGRCVGTSGIGQTYARWELNLDELPPELIGSLSWRLETDVETHMVLPGRDTFSVAIQEPICGRVVATNRATGEVVEVDEICVGEDIAASLGPRSNDPSDELAQVCEGEPYVCEVVGDQWEEGACTPWTGEPEEDAGGSPAGDDPVGDAIGCSVDSPSGGAGPVALGLFVLLGLARRRRRADPG